eukprot:75112_1
MSGDPLNDDGLTDMIEGLDICNFSKISLQTTLKIVNERSKGTNDKVDGVEQKVNVIKDSIGELKGRIGQSDGSGCPSIHDKLAGTKVDVDIIKDSIGELKGRIGQSDGSDDTSLYAKLTETDGKVVGLKNSIDKLQSQIGPIQEAGGDGSQVVETLDARTTRLFNEIRQLKQLFNDQSRPSPGDAKILKEIKSGARIRVVKSGRSLNVSFLKFGGGSIPVKS